MDKGMGFLGIVLCLVFLGCAAYFYSGYVPDAKVTYVPQNPNCIPGTENSFCSGPQYSYPAENNPGAAGNDLTGLGVSTLLFLFAGIPVFYHGLTSSPPIYRIAFIRKVRWQIQTSMGKAGIKKLSDEEFTTKDSTLAYVPVLSKIQKHSPDTNYQLVDAFYSEFRDTSKSSAVDELRALSERFIRQAEETIMSGDNAETQPQGNDSAFWNFTQGNEGR